MKSSISTLLIVLGLIFSSAVGQENLELDRLEQKTSIQLKQQLSGWSYKRLPPFTPGSNVLDQKWSSGNRIVMVAIAVRATADDAKNEVREALRYRKGIEQLIGFGNEAYDSGINGSNIVLRRGRYVIYININAEVDADEDARMLSRSQREEKRKSEVQRIRKEFTLVYSTVDLE
jgi:hypothetical protein